MTKQEMLDKLKSLGIKKRFKPYWDTGCEKILIEVRKPDRCEIALMPDGFDVWTTRKKLANSYAKADGLKVNLLTGEAVLSVPARLADAILPVFGAKVRMNLSDSERARRSALGKRFCRVKQGLRGADGFQRIDLSPKNV